MKALFLDFDGTLNTVNRPGVVPSWVAREGFDVPKAWILPHLVYRLRPFMAIEDLVIVISSTWRFDFPLGDLRRILDEAHHGIGQLVFDSTPRLLSVSRGGAISLWIKRKRPSGYAILDDEEIRHPRLRPHQVLVDPNSGLSEFDVKLAMEILKRS